MGKYLKEKCENTEGLRKQRKSFYRLFVVAWFFIALSIALAKNFSPPEPSSWTVGQLLTLVTGIIAFIFAIKFFIQMNMTIKLIYVQSAKFFILYLVLLTGGFATGFLWIIPLILIWVHSKKLIGSGVSG